MIPRAAADSSTAIPDTFEYWTPRPSDISEEGFGYFRDVWPITDVTASEAREIIHAEDLSLLDLDAACGSEEEFDRVAGELEVADPDADRLEPEFHGLEVGVAGAVLALAHCGFYPAASCRGHLGTTAWSDRPVIYFAADRVRATNLVGLAAQVNASVHVDDNRSELLCLVAPSVTDMNRLAKLIFDRRAELRRIPKTSRRQAPRREHLPRDPPLSLF